MGQAQLLLIVLGVVLVGIAIIAGIQAFEQNSRKGAQDAMMHDALRAASDIQAWAQKPEQFGGPVGTAFGKVSGANWAKVGYRNANGDATPADGPWTTTNGSYALTANGTDGLTITGTSALYTDVKVSVSVCGIDAKDIKGAVGDTPVEC